MQRILSTTIGFTALVTSIVIGGNLSVISQFAQPVNAQVAAATKPIVLKLAQAKKVADKAGFKLLPVTSVNPGDTIVYTIAANNISDRPIGKLVVNQKIRPGTTYVLNSATPVKGTDLTFSIDGGKSYTAQPTIAKKPAPATSYTNVRWNFIDKVAPKSNSNLSYEVRVR